MKPNTEGAQEVAWLIYSHPELTKPGDIAVGMTVASFTNDKGEAWPSNETISKRAHVGHTFVSESIERLKAAGILGWIDRTAKGESNLYTIPALVCTADQTPSGKRIGSKTQSNRHASTETADGRILREHKERREHEHQKRKEEREAKERAEAAPVEEQEQLRAEMLQRAIASGRVVEG
jgi:hypothetical protein